MAAAARTESLSDSQRIYSTSACTNDRKFDRFMIILLFYKIDLLFRNGSPEEIHCLLSVIGLQFDPFTNQKILPKGTFIVEVYLSLVFDFIADVAGKAGERKGTI